VTWRSGALQGTHTLRVEAYRRRSQVCQTVTIQRPLWEGNDPTTQSAAAAEVGENQEPMCYRLPRIG
jgi:hypothetical protein